MSPEQPAVNPFRLSDEELDVFLARLGAAMDNACNWGRPHPTPREKIPAAFRGPAAVTDAETIQPPAAPSEAATPVAAG